MNVHGARSARHAALIILLLSLFSAPGAATALEDVIARNKPSIVAIGTFQRTRNPQFAFRGTGFIVGDGTLVATNAHVLPGQLDLEKLETIAVVIPATERDPLQRRDARAVVIDTDHDLALLRIQGAALPPLAISGDAAVRDGQAAAFTGFPMGVVLGLIPVSHRATISAITPVALPTSNAKQLDVKMIRRLQAGPFPVLQLDATAYPGNSGSPLYDAQTGGVIGIINMVFVKSTKEAILSEPSGISFAVPAQYLQNLVTGLKE